MDMISLSKCFRYDARKELSDMIKLFKAGADFVFPAGMADHFRIAKKKPAVFRNHPPTLGISLGGSNTKAIIASMANGDLIVHHVVSTKNPDQSTHYMDYLDTLLCADPAINAYVKNTPERGLGFSFPMSVIDGVPFHATKVPTLDGLIARTHGPEMRSFHFARNLERYLENRQLPSMPTFYQGDGIVAHHGAASLYDLAPEDKSVLLVCGTGLATGDEQAYIQIGIAPLLKEDCRLYPPDQTEDRQLQYAVAGKGLFGLMARAISLRSDDPSSPLSGLDIDKRFTSAEDSRTVEDIWMASFGDANTVKKVQEVLGLSDPKVMIELQWISNRIMQRVISSLANCVLSTIVSTGRSDSGRGHTVFFEGSVATSPNVLPRMKQEILERAALKKVFESHGVLSPLQPQLEANLRRLKAADGLDVEAIEDVDITLIGAVTAMMAENSIRKV